MRTLRSKGVAVSTTNASNSRVFLMNRNIFSKFELASKAHTHEGKVGIMIHTRAAPSSHRVQLITNGFAIAAISATTVGASLWASAAISSALGLGPLSHHMIDHITLLVVAAPIAAWLLRDTIPTPSLRIFSLIVALHIGLICFWHLPPIFDAASSGPALHILMSVTLYVVGLFFWTAIIGLGKHRWQAILALLMTGKLFCLFAALLVFSPRLLYASLAHGHHAHPAGISGLADQQLAGLIMLAVCPLAYVTSGVIIAARWLLDIERASPEPTRLGPPVRSSLMVLPLILLLGGCSDVQSVMSPASADAERILQLTWILFIGGAIIFLIVIAILAVALAGGTSARRHIASIRAVTLGGIAFPIVVLSVLLGYGVWLTRADAASSDEAREITVQGERWWWRVTYHDEDVTRLASANEIRLEAGRPVHINLTSQDVIHSFWVPALAGKVDAIPGRTNTLSFTPDKPGIYRGQCAEYCGGPHALMALRVVVMSSEDYAQWIDGERRPASEPEDALSVHGAEVFRTSCIACHAVRGTDARGQLGPDLTHVANRAMLGGEVLDMSKENLARWITDNQSLKPNNQMPEFRNFSNEDLGALAAYLAQLR